MKIPLAEVLGMIRDQLNEANDAALRSERPVMIFDECEVEFAVDVEYDAALKAKVLTFISLGGGAKKSDSNTVKVKFKAFDNKGTLAAGFDVTKPGPPPGKRVTPPRPKGRGS
jgi:hypothetical protein